MKLAVQKNHLGGQILYTSLGLSKKRRHSSVDFLQNFDKIFFQIYPTQEIEELVRCFSCKTWFKRNCVGINEAAYKQLVLEQNYCAWSCQSCITNKVVNSCVQKIPNDNNNSTNQPIPPNAPVHDVPIKPEKERKKRKNSKQNGKQKGNTPFFGPCKLVFKMTSFISF